MTVEECREKIASLEREIQDLRSDLLRYVQLDKRASSEFDATIKNVQEEIIKDISELAASSEESFKRIADESEDKVTHLVNAMFAKNNEALLQTVDEKIRNFLQHQ